MESNQVYMFHAPTKFDIKPLGTIWHNQADDLIVDRYIQLSHDETSPNWQNIGQFLQGAFNDRLEDQNFIESCIELYEKSF